LYRIVLSLLIAVCAAITVTAPARAQSFPVRPVTVVVPFPAGGGTDILVRLIQEKMSTELGQQLVLDNKPGATGNIGGAYVANATPDGYTLLVQATIIGMFSHIFPNLSYDPVHDFVPIGGIAETATVLVVNAESKIMTLADLIKEARARPAALNYGTAGVGSPSHLAAEMMGKLNDAKITHVPYKGTAPAVQDVLGQFTQFGAFTLSAVLPLIQDGKFRALAIAGEKRTILLPDVPTVKELGFGDVFSGTRFVLLAPLKTPTDVTARLTAALTKVVADAAIQDGFLKRGYEVTQATPDQVRAMLTRQYETWGPLVKELKLQFD
jgi:tripartite-type tricarboxylate transporter receptor subunit TctC